MTEVRAEPLLARLVRGEGYAGGPQVVAELRRVIASGQVPPGTPVPLDEVARFFDLSRIPVREALMTLVGEGLLQHRPRLGYTVTELTADELLEMYLARQALEEAAMTTAARRAGATDRARAQEACRRELEVAGDPVAYQASSRVFHESLSTPCRMPRLLHMLGIAWNVTEPAQAMRRVEGADRHQLQAEHANMLAAFVAGDAEALVGLVRDHNQHVMQAVARIS